MVPRLVITMTMFVVLMTEAIANVSQITVPKVSTVLTVTATTISMTSLRRRRRAVM